MSEEKKPFVFNYSKYKSKSIGIDTLDTMINIVVSAGTSRWATIVAGLKLVIFFMYIWTRKALIEQEFEIEKQNYELNRVNENDDIINNDNLD